MTRSKSYRSRSHRKYRVPPSTLAAGSNALGTPRLEAVFGMSCINPRAPLGETARGLKLLSALITLLIRSASRRCLSLAAPTTWSRFRMGCFFSVIDGSAGAAAFWAGGGMGTGVDAPNDAGATTLAGADAGVGTGVSSLSKCSICSVGTST